MTFGYLIGEVIRRIAGQSVGRFFATEIADPLDADFHIGLPEPELGRCSELQGVRPMVVGDQRAHDGVAVLDVAPAGWRE